GGGRGSAAAREPTHDRDDGPERSGPRDEREPARGEDARRDELEEPSEQEPRPGRDEGVEGAGEHAAARHLERPEQQGALGREEDPAPAERVAERQRERGRRGGGEPRPAPQDPASARTSPTHAAPGPPSSATGR